MLVWLDLETTGLDASVHTILEVACIITDDKLVEVGRLHRVTNKARDVDYTKLHQAVKDMHWKNGLWMSSLRLGVSVGLLGEIDSELAAFVDEHVPNFDGKSAPQLAGNTVSFDREFAKKHLPSFARRLHYRHLDTSSINELARRFWPKVYDGRPGAQTKPEDLPHRAIDDIEMSLAVTQYYAAAFGVVG